MNADNHDDREALLSYLTQEEPREASGVGTDAEKIAHSIDRDILPLLSRIGHVRDPSPYECETECASAVSRLEKLTSLPVTPAGTVRFLGEYELSEELGRGGMGTVYKARHAKLGKFFAVKVLSTKWPGNERAVAWFLREMRAVGKIEHENVVCATDAGEADEIHYLAMELVNGVNLSELVKATGPLAVADACEIARRAALGLKAIHKHGLVHRDVKPSNLMLTDAGQIKLMDLGLALLLDASATSGVGESHRAVGTMPYMAPEQFVDAHRVDARADLYGLGCTLHYLLTGLPPSHGSRASTDNAELTNALDRLLAHDPADRFASAADVATALQVFCAGADLGRLALRSPEASAAGIDTAESQLATRDFTIRSKRGRPPEQRVPGLFLIATVLLLACAILAAWSLTRNRTGELVLAINQPDAVVLIDGKPPPRGTRIENGQVTLQLATGKHRIEIQAKGHKRWSERITINSREPERLVVRLVPRANEGNNADTAPAGDPDTPNRQLAKWVLTRGGSLHLPSGSDIHSLPELPDGELPIQNVVLSRKELRDEDVARFLGMANLQGLELSHNLLSSRSAEVLSQVRTVRWLYLNGNHAINDDAARHLGAMTNLETLDLRITRVTDATVEELTTLSNLRELRLAYTGVTSDCLKHVSSLGELVRLDVAGTKVGDGDLSQLHRLKKLKYLLLASTRITNDAVDDLKSLTNLSELDVQNTALSPAALQELRAALPGCQVRF